MAEDLVQEFFLRLWENDYLERIGASTLETYLYSSVRNACYTSLVLYSPLCYSCQRE